MRSIAVFSGSSHPALVDQICARLGVTPSPVTLGKFSNGETKVEIFQTVREKDVYIVQTGCGKVNDYLMELLVLIQACKTASARKVTAIIPCFPYSRQPDAPYQRSGAPLTRAPPMTVPGTPKEVKSPHDSGRNSPVPFTAIGEPISHHASPEVVRYAMNKAGVNIPSAAKPTPINLGALNGKLANMGLAEKSSGYRQWVARAGTLVADLLTCAGADHIITMDLHDPQFQGFFDCPVDNLLAMPLICKYIKENIPNYKDAVVVSPDAGGAKRAAAIADRLHLDFALIHKDRKPPIHANLSTPSTSTQCPVPVQPKPDLMLVGNVRNKPCLLIDDIADTSFTITKAAKCLHENGATHITALLTHGIFSGDALERIEKSWIDEIIVTDSVPQDEHVQKCSKVKVLGVAGVLAEAVRRIHHGESVSMLFRDGVIS